MLMPPEALEKWRSKHVQLPLWVNTVLCRSCSSLFQCYGTEATSFHQSKEPSNRGKGSLRRFTYGDWLQMKKRAMNWLDPTWVIYNTARLTLEWRRPFPCRREQVQNCPGRLNLSSAAQSRKPWSKDSLEKVEGSWEEILSSKLPVRLLEGKMQLLLRSLPVALINSKASCHGTVRNTLS